VPPITDHYAIAIGIDTYPSLRRLTSSVGDATRFCEWLMDEDGGNLHPDNVRLVPSPKTTPGDRFDAKPIRDEIDRVLRDFGAELGTRIGQRLYFYFAGHGFGPSFDNVGMVMANASMDTLPHMNIGLREYRHYFHETGLFDEVVFILDCCRDNARDENTNGPQWPPKPVAGKAAQVVDFVALAAGYGEKAFAPVDQIDGERRGILTKALLEALRGDLRAIDPKGRVTAATLKTFLTARVNELAKGENLKQEAKITDDPNLVLHQVDVTKVTRLKVHIIATARLTAGELIVREGTNREEIARRKVDEAREAQPWEIDLLPITRYDIEHSDSDANAFLNPDNVKKEPHVIRV
jgi:uncharacterized caspase-like protein